MVKTRSKTKAARPKDENELLKIKELRKTNPVKAKALLKKMKKKKAKKNKKKKTKELNPLKEKKRSEKSTSDNVEYIEEDVDEALMENFGDVYKRFRSNATEEGQKEQAEQNGINFNLGSLYSDSDSDSDSDSGSDSEVNTDSILHPESKKKKTEENSKGKEKRNISKKHLKLMNKPSVMKLKVFAEKPEIVEIWDTSASDPFFYVWLKGLKNTVNVPQHWCLKRKYMQGKRGIEKQPYVLPHYIEDTKISEIRQSIREREEQKSTKQKMRDRVRPKLHAMDIDYQTLHDAFFKYATKPKLVKFGDLYYEGKELELQTKKFRPGVISAKLRKALNLEENEPLPWIINMQKYGIPPSFPYLQIKGVNYFPKEGTENGATAVTGTITATKTTETTATVTSGGGGVVNSSSPDGKNNQYKYDTIDSDGNLVYANFASVHTFGKYPENFLWGEIEEREEESEDDEEEEGEEKEKKETKKEKEDKEKEREKEEELHLNAAGKEDISKMGYASGTYSVLTNSKLSGTYTPFMESGMTSVDLTSFIPGYETPRYINAENWNITNLKPYTILQTEEAPISQKALFGSNVKYKINPNDPYMNKNSNRSEGFSTPFSNGMNTPFTPFENVLSEKTGIGYPHDNTPYDTNVENVRKELSKFEEISNKFKGTSSAQTDSSKKVKKEEKKKKKKKDFKF